MEEFITGMMTAIIQNNKKMKKFSTMLMAILMIASTNIAAFAQGKAVSDKELAALGFDAKRLELVTQKIKADIEAARYHGVRMVVARKGEVVLDVTEGYADYESREKLNEDAVFAAMSVTKQFTNVIALKMVEEGKLKLHAPVAEVIPEFATFGKEKVSLYHLLTHTAGVVSAIPRVSPDVLMSISKSTAYAANLPLESQPGERITYSAIVAHAVIAEMCVRADGGERTFTQILNEDLFEPLKMYHTSLGPREDLLKKLAPVKGAYQPGVAAIFPAEKMAKFGKMISTPGAEQPGGGAFTTAQDLYRFSEMLRRGGELDGVRILSPAMIEFTTQNFTGELRNTLFDMWGSTRHWMPNPGYLGIGWFIRGEGNINGIFSPLHSRRAFGGVGTGATAFTVDPEKELTISFLSTGLMEDSYHFERLSVLSTMIIASMTE